MTFSPDQEGVVMSSQITHTHHTIIQHNPLELKDLFPFTMAGETEELEHECGLNWFPAFEHGNSENERRHNQKKARREERI